MIEVKPDGTVEVKTWAEALKPWPQLAECARELDAANAREAREWSYILSASTPQERADREIELIAASLDGLDRRHAIAVAALLVESGCHYEPVYQTCGALQQLCLGDDELQAIDADGYPLDRLARWLKAYRADYQARRSTP